MHCYYVYWYNIATHLNIAWQIYWFHNAAGDFQVSLNSLESIGMDKLFILHPWCIYLLLKNSFICELRSVSCARCLKWLLCDIYVHWIEMRWERLEFNCHSSAPEMIASRGFFLSDKATLIFYMWRLMLLININIKSMYITYRGSSNFTLI